jgi:hypothetical protein
MKRTEHSTTTSISRATDGDSISHYIMISWLISFLVFGTLTSAVQRAFLIRSKIWLVGPDPERVQRPSPTDVPNSRV